MALRAIAIAAPKAVGIALAVMAIAIAANAQTHGTYSSLAYSAEGSDLNGYEVEFIPTNKGLKAVVQVAEGEVDGIYVVDVKQSSEGELSFPIPLNTEKEAVFVGKISGNELSGEIALPAGREKITLKRSAGYWNHKLHE